MNALFQMRQLFTEEYEKKKQDKKEKKIKGKPNLAVEGIRSIMKTKDR